MTHTDSSLCVCFSVSKERVSDLFCVFFLFYFFFTLSPSSLSSSWAELGGDGVVDLLPGGEGELWVEGFPFSPSWDWLIVDSWFCWLTPDWLLGPSAALIGCWLLVNRESEFTICCIWAKTGSDNERQLLHLRSLGTCIHTNLGFTNLVTATSFSGFYEVFMW